MLVIVTMEELLARTDDAIPREICEEFVALERELADHDRRYYVETAPLIGDDAYDALRRRWNDLRIQFPALAAVSLGAKIGDDCLEKFQKRHHLSPMKSLNNTYNKKELREFVDRVERASDRAVDFVLEPKIDGAALSLVFRGGGLAYALSRGNGEVGDDVTANVLTIRDLPRNIPCKNELCEIRGEVYIAREDFSKINGERELDGFEPFANARNLAAGSLKLLDSKMAAGRSLRFLAYEISAGADGFVSHMEVLETLRTWNFPTNEGRLLCGFANLWDAVENFATLRRNYSFDTDGVVVKVNSRDLRNRLGAQATAPRWAIAY
ncbi:MAG: NAD-dependent DNA ligase LigA, partial [Puniceicoccales bacterium]|nr:NAD-dependent DNA ligase LigA [Puniceicoccales bacterium]